MPFSEILVRRTPIEAPVRCGPGCGRAHSIAIMARAEDAARRAELAAGHRQAEAARAQKLIDEFLLAVREAEIAPVELRARLLSGHPVRTDRQGWYLRRDRSIAIGTDGGYYQLLVPGGWRERLRGVRLQPSPAPMVVGRGAKDGEAGDLRFFLDRFIAERGAFTQP